MIDLNYLLARNYFLRWCQMEKWRGVDKNPREDSTFGYGETDFLKTTRPFFHFAPATVKQFLSKPTRPQEGKAPEAYQRYVEDARRPRTLSGNLGTD